MNRICFKIIRRTYVKINWVVYLIFVHLKLYIIKKKKERKQTETHMSLEISACTKCTCHWPEQVTRPNTNQWGRKIYAEEWMVAEQESKFYNV